MEKSSNQGLTKHLGLGRTFTGDTYVTTVHFANGSEQFVEQHIYIYTQAPSCSIATHLLKERGHVSKLCMSANHHNVTCTADEQAASNTFSMFGIDCQCKGGDVWTVG